MTISDNLFGLQIYPAGEFWMISTIILGLLSIFLIILIIIKNKNFIREKERLTQENLQKVTKLKTEFLNQMSHEIRTPVNTMLSFSSLIKEELQETMTDDLRLSFNVIDSGGRRLIRTIDLILNVSELQLGTYEPRFSKIDIYNNILYPLQSEFLSHAANKGIKLQFNCEAENSLVFIDHYSVTQIFINLIDNAIKYTKEGYVCIEIYNSNGKLIVEVRDSGIGISSSYLENIFEPFSQEETGYTRPYEGTGLGLSLVKKCTEINKAGLEIESKKDVGTCVKVIFTN